MREALSGVSQQFADEYCKLAKKPMELPILRCDTMFPAEFVKEHNKEIQSHLHRIADFLLPGRGIWWEELREAGSIIFHDSIEKPDFHAEGPLLHRFRNTSVDEALDHVRCCWLQVTEIKS